MTTRELNSLPVRQLELQDKQGQQMQQGSRNEEKERLWCHWRARRAAGGRPPKRSYVSPRRRTSHPFPDGSIPIRLPLSVLPGRLFCMSLRVCAVWISFVSSAAISLTRSTASQQRQRQAFSALFLFCLRRRTFCRHCVRKVLLTKFNTYCASLGVRFVACLHKETQTEFMLWHFKLRNFYEIRWLRLPSTSLLNLQQPLATATEILGQFEANFFVQHSNNIQKKQKKGTTRNGVHVQVRGPARSRCQPGVLFMFMFRLDQRPRKPKTSEISPSETTREVRKLHHDLRWWCVLERARISTEGVYTT